MTSTRTNRNRLLLTALMGIVGAPSDDARWDYSSPHPGDPGKGIRASPPPKNKMSSREAKRRKSKIKAQKQSRRRNRA